MMAWIVATMVVALLAAVFVTFRLINREMDRRAAERDDWKSINDLLDQARAKERDRDRVAVGNSR